MLKFLRDIVSTLYDETKQMSLFRLTFAVSFFILMGICVGDLCSVEHTFNHYIELCGFVAGLGTLCAGNKIINQRGAHDEQR